MRVGRIPYINCYAVYGAIDRGLVPLEATLVSGVPTALNRQMAAGSLDVSVVSAVEYARHVGRYLLLPDLAISCDGPVRSVMLFSRCHASELGGRRVLVSRSSMTSVALLELLFQHVWGAAPRFVAGDAEVADIHRFAGEDHDARLVIGDAALHLSAGVRQNARPAAAGSRSGGAEQAVDAVPHYPFAYDLGAEWKSWTGLPFVFAVWVAQRSTPAAASMRVHQALIASRDWGLGHLDELAAQAASATGVAGEVCRAYLAGLEYRLTAEHLNGLTEFFHRLSAAGHLAGSGPLSFLPAA